MIWIRQVHPVAWMLARLYRPAEVISVKKHFGTTDRSYLYLSGWMVAALRSEFGPLPDQSMHEKTSVPALIEELYTFLRQADARELGMLFREIDKARATGDKPFVNVS
jgi:isocitrate lyase